MQDKLSDLMPIDKIIETARKPDDTVLIQTDLDKMKSLFDQFGLEYTHITDLNSIKKFVEKESDIATQAIQLESHKFNAAKDCKIVGYMGFFTDFYFDSSGKFLVTGLWE
jgi:hypothetical protein